MDILVIENGFELAHDLPKILLYSFLADRIMNKL